MSFQGECAFWPEPAGEMTLPPANQPIFENTCHEGNCALGDAMRGARKQHADQAAAKAKQ